MKKLRIISIFFITIILASITISPVSQVFAVNDFYSSNDVLFYDSNASDCPSFTPNNGIINTSENLTVILNYMTGKGLSLAAAAGIAGNLFQESGYNPAKIQGGSIAPDNYTPVNGTGFGLAQWTFTSRQQPLIDFAASQGKNITNLGMQLDYTWQELNTRNSVTLQGLNTIKSTSTFGTTSAPMAAAIVFHGYTKDIINSGITQEITDVLNANIGFKEGVGGFEGSGDTTQMVIGNRGKRAEAIYNTYKPTIPDGTGVVGISTAIAGSSGTSICGGSTVSGDATWPDNVIAYGEGWTILDNTDYSNVQCAIGSTDSGIYYHPIRKFTIRKCSTPIGEVSSLISQKALSMISSAAQSGVILTGGSWRSYETQISMRNSNCPDPLNSLSSDCEPPTAKAGNSQHEKGLAIDFNGVGRVGSGPEWDWLVANAASYGFFNLQSEGWHWSMSGN